VTAALWLRALGLRFSVPLLVRAFPLDRVLGVLTPNASARRSSRPPSLDAIESAADAVTRRRPLRTACLERALVRYALLRAEGHPVRFAVGVRPGGCDGFEAHAWVMLEEKPIMEREPVDYRPTFVWPDRAA
jgi:hypothetical protein